MRRECIVIRHCRKLPLKQAGCPCKPGPESCHHDLLSFFEHSLSVHLIAQQTLKNPLIQEDIQTMRREILDPLKKIPGQPHTQNSCSGGRSKPAPFLFISHPGSF